MGEEVSQQDIASLIQELDRDGNGVVLFDGQCHLLTSAIIDTDYLFCFVSIAEFLEAADKLEGRLTFAKPVPETARRALSPGRSTKF